MEVAAVVARTVSDDEAAEAAAQVRIEPGDRKEVYLIQSSPPGGGRARLRSRPYPLPGDKFTAYELNLFDLDARKATRPQTMVAVRNFLTMASS